MDNMMGMHNEMNMITKKKKKMMPKENDMSEYDDSYYRTPLKKKDKGFYGHTKAQTLF